MRAKPPPPGPYDAEGLLRLAADRLRALMDSIQINGAGEHDSTVKNLARTSQAISATCSELRQIAKAHAIAVALVPEIDIIRRLQALPDDRRAAVCREILGTVDDGPVL